MQRTKRCYAMQTFHYSSRWRCGFFIISSLFDRFFHSVTMVLEAGYPNTTGFRKVVKVTILVKKRPGLSDEDFMEYYNHQHAQIAAPVLEKHHCITYSLVWVPWPAMDRVARGFNWRAFTPALLKSMPDVLPEARSNHYCRHAPREIGRDAGLRGDMHIRVQRLQRLCQIHVRPGI